MPDKHFGTVKLVIFCKQFTTQNFKIFNIDKKVIDNLLRNHSELMIIVKNPLWLIRIMQIFDSERLNLDGAIA